MRRREHRDDAQRAAGAAGDFHRQGDHVKSPDRKLTEVGKVFEHRDVVGEELDVRFKLGRLAIVDGGGVDPDGLNLSLTDKPGCRFRMQARKTERSYTFRPSQLCS